VSWLYAKIAFGSAVLVATALAGKAAWSETGHAEARIPKCIHYSTQAVLGVAGYNHLVYISNACTKEALCEVATSANPTPIDVSVPPSETRAVITYRESPARVFEAKVRCRLEGS
jgi:hypothetical protein